MVGIETLIHAHIPKNEQNYSDWFFITIFLSFSFSFPYHINNNNNKPESTNSQSESDDPWEKIK